MRMAVSDRDMCVHQLQRKSVPNNSIAPLELSTQLNSTTNQIEPKRTEAKENQFGKLQAHVAARSHWQIESCHLTPRCTTCHLPPVCQPASESPSAALWLLSTMAKAKKKRKKSAQKTETQMKTHINCAFVSINEQGPTQFKDMKNFGTENDFPHTHSAHTHTWRTWQLFGSFYATLLVLLPFLPFVELKMSTWVASTVSVCTHQYKHTLAHTYVRFLMTVFSSCFRVNCCRFKKWNKFLMCQVISWNRRHWHTYWGVCESVSVCVCAQYFLKREQQKKDLSHKLDIAK